MGRLSSCRLLSLASEETKVSFHDHRLPNLNGFVRPLEWELTSGDTEGLVGDLPGPRLLLPS